MGDRIVVLCGDMCFGDLYGAVAEAIAFTEIGLSNGYNYCYE